MASSTKIYNTQQILFSIIISLLIPHIHSIPLQSSQSTQPTDIHSSNQLCTDSNGHQHECTKNELFNIIENNANNQQDTTTNNTDQQRPNYEDMDFSLDPSNYDYPLPCPGLAAGYECDYTSSWSTRDGQYDFCDIDVIHINDLTLSIIIKVNKHKNI